MTEPDNCKGLFASWDTAKTTTQEIVLMGPHGILSIKVVYSGKRTQVYSGFDVATWDRWPTMHNSLWEHKYIEAQEKNAKKYGAVVMTVEDGSAEDILGYIGGDFETAVRNAASGLDEKVSSHWRMFLGLEEGVSSARGAPRDPVPVTPKINPADERRKLQMADADWGRF